MALDFLQVSQQIKQLGDKAYLDQHEIVSKLAEIRQQLEDCASALESLQNKVQEVVRAHDPSLRCAVPVSEALNSRHPLPEMPEQVSVIAADGSQIFADRHAEVEYCLVNTGAIWMQYGMNAAP